MVLFFILFFLSYSLHAQQSFIEDQTCATIFGHQQTIVITKRDVERSAIMGRNGSLQDIIDEWLIWDAAQELKLPRPDDAIEKYLIDLQKKNNMSADQFSKALAHQGYPIEQFKEDLGRMYIVNNMLDFKIRSHIVIPREKIVAYYNDNPIKKSASFKLIIAFIPFSKKLEVNDQRAHIEQMLQQNLLPKKIKWGNAFWIDAQDIATNKQFITHMAVNDYYLAEEVDGFRVYRLVEKKDESLVPLEDRYAEITMILRRDIEEQALEEYKKELRNRAIIIMNSEGCG